MQHRFAAVFLVSLSVLLGPKAWAQTPSIFGMVRDPSGAGVSGATVIVRDISTGVRRATTTDDAGRYQVFSLAVGDYEVRVRKPGFTEQVRTGIHVAVGEQATVDVRLEIGPLSEQVTVRADAAPVTPATTEISGLVGRREIADLPLNGRSYDELLTLDPGIVNYTSAKTGGVGVSNSTVGNNFAVSGNRPQQNLFLLNGVEFTGAAENNMQPGGTSQQLLGVGAIREFNVLRDSYGAEYGKRPGAQVLMATESGTNQWHGSLYEFLRNNAFDARNFFDRASAPGFERNQFGGALGGPITKDKTFFFGNYEGFRQHLHQTGVDLVPDTNARQGLLPCRLVTPAPSPCPPSGLVNVGVAASVEPLLNLWPTPSAGAPDFGGISEAFNNPLQTIRDDFGTLRLDRALSDRDAASGVYTIDDSADVTPTSTNLYSTDLESLREQVASAEESHVFSPALVNTLLLGYSRASYFFTGEPTPGTPAASVPGFLVGHPVGAVVVGGSAAANPAAQVSLAGSNIGSNLTITRNLFTYQDRVTWARGRHQWNVGGWFERVQANEDLALSQFGQATFSGLQSFLTGTAKAFLFDPAPTPLGWRSWLGAWYLADVARLTPKLTLSLGFRDEFTRGWNEVHGRAANFVFSQGVIQTAPRVATSAFTVNRASSLPQPRLGLAWSPFEKTVLRAGFGLYNDLQDALGYRLDQNAPFNPSYSIDNFPVSDLPLSGPVPSGAKVLPGGVQPDLETPTLVSYSLRLERQLSPDTVLTVGYVGSHGYHEILSLDDNEPVPTVCPASPCPAGYPPSFPPQLSGAAIPAGTFFIPPGTPRANPGLGSAWAWFSAGDSSYHALQLDLNRRFSRGLALRGGYTWAKALDDGDSLNATASGNAPGLVSNPFDLRADKGPATYDVRNAASISGTYDLPFGRDKRFFARRSGLAEGLASGWTLNSILTLQSGFPFTPQLSYNPSNNGDTRNPVRRS